MLAPVNCFGQIDSATPVHNRALEPGIDLRLLGMTRTLYMTVLQQVRDYYTTTAQPSADIAKKVVQRVVTPEGIKHPTPQDYYASHIQKQDDAAPAAKRLLSEQA